MKSGQPRPPESAVRLRVPWASIVAVAIVAVLLFPLYWIVNVSLMTQTDMLRYPPPFVPPNLTFDGYRAALERAGGYVLSSMI